MNWIDGLTLIKQSKISNTLIEQSVIIDLLLCKFIVCIHIQEYNYIYIHMNKVLTKRCQCSFLKCPAISCTCILTITLLCTTCQVRACHHKPVTCNPMCPDCKKHKELGHSTQETQMHVTSFTHQHLLT